MSLLDQASLVLVPSAIKTGEVLVQKPLPTKFSDETGNYDGNDPQGSANLTFTRNSNATRVNADGLVEKVRTNELLYSNDFSNAYWAKSGVTLTAGQSDADGGNNAWKIDFASGANSYLGKFSMGSTQTKTNSIWLRADSPVQIGFNNGQSSNAVTLTTSWVRYSVTQLGTSNAGLQLDNYFGVSTPQLAVTFYAYQAQNEVSDFGPTDYIPTTTAAVSVGPTANVPRLDYSGGATCGRLLLEPQRTNQTLYSEQFDNGWASSVTIVPNQAVSPDGYQNADLLYSTSSGSGKRVLRSSGVTVSTAYTFSVYAKAAGQNFIYFPDVNNLVNNVWFDLSNGTFSTPSQGTASMIDCGNGWYRCVCTTTATTTGGYSYIGISSTSGSTVFNTDGTTGVYVWGAQLEAGSYATSYIPTLGASVTRLADAAYKTGISSLIGQTEGTIFWEGVINGSDNAYANIVTSERNVTSAFSVLYKKGDSTFQCAVFDGTTKGQCTGGNVVVGQKHKLAYAYKSGDFALYVDGVQVATNTQTWTPPSTIDDLYLGDTTTFFGYKEGNQHNQTLLFKTRLTNAQLAELTTL